MKILNKGNAQVIETFAEAFGALKYKGEFKTKVASERPTERKDAPKAAERK